nr:B3 domain-containing protein REM10-like [Ipomoea batatas]
MVEPIARDTTSTLPADHPYFVSTIKSYCLRKSHLYLPLVFARSNGLVAKGKREMILIDDKERSWSVVLGREANHFSLQHGWEAFQMANGLKEGDAYKFELIKSGEKPIAKLSSLGTTSSSSAENPHFVATIKPYCLRKSQLYLPLEFARSNGLMAEEKREMILRDDRERSWPVVLGTMGKHVSLLRGWQAFRMAKGLKEGDAYKFELIKSGKKPIAKFHFSTVLHDGRQTPSPPDYVVATKTLSDYQSYLRYVFLFCIQLILSEREKPELQITTSKSRKAYVAFPYLLLSLLSFLKI